MADEDVNLYDEIEIEDCFYDPTLQIYHHPCPCGDRFEISIADMRDGEDIARCPSCSLMIRIIFDEVGVTFSPSLRFYWTLTRFSPIYRPTMTMRRRLLPSLRRVIPANDETSTCDVRHDDSEPRAFQPVLKSVWHVEKLSVFAFHGAAYSWAL
jgi:diphthamide biosynthesis protein 3